MNALIDRIETLKAELAEAQRSYVKAAAERDKAEHQRDAALEDARVQNRAAAEEIGKREAMQKNWDQMVTNIAQLTRERDHAVEQGRIDRAFASAAHVIAHAKETRLRESVAESVRLYVSYGLLAQHSDCGRWINGAREVLAAVPASSWLRTKLVEFGHRLVAKQLEGAGCAVEISEGISKTMSAPIEALAEEFTA